MKSGHTRRGIIAIAVLTASVCGVTGPPYASASTAGGLATASPSASPEPSAGVLRSIGFGYPYGFNSGAVDLGYADKPRGFADANGDGRADYCRFVGSSSAPYLSCMLAYPWGFGPSYGFNSGPVDLGYADKPRGFADVNGDGRADYCRFVGSSSAPYLSCMLANTGGFGYQYAFNSGSVDLGFGAHGFADANGDGRADFCRYIGQIANPSYSCMFALASGGFGPQYGFTSGPTNPGQAGRPRGYADVNGDGEAEFCRTVAVGQTSDSFIQCHYVRTYQTVSAYSVNNPDYGYVDKPRGFADVNGDGRDDFCRIVGSTSSPYVSCMLATL